MAISHMLILSAAALAASMGAGYGGPCANEIEQTQARVNAWIDAKSMAAVRSAPQSEGARLHRQPTPGSIGAAGRRLGEGSKQTMVVVMSAMARAREADAAGDRPACEQILADVHRAIGPLDRQR
jgi:hypothetical protein